MLAQKYTTSCHKDSLLPYRLIIEEDEFKTALKRL